MTAAEVEAESLLAIVLLPVDDGVDIDIATVEEGESEKRRRTTESNEIRARRRLPVETREQGDVLAQGRSLHGGHDVAVRGDATIKATFEVTGDGRSEFWWEGLNLEIEIGRLSGGLGWFLKPRSVAAVWDVESDSPWAAGGLERDREGETMRLPG